MTARSDEGAAQPNRPPKLVTDAAAGLAQEARLLASDKTGTLVWTARRKGLVCPAAYRNRAGLETGCAALAKHGWPVVFRPTGGGTVPQGPGIVNLAMSFDAPPGFTIEDGYRLITCVLQTACGSHQGVLEPGSTPNSFCDGTWNLSIGGRKIVGTAQRWRSAKKGRARVLVHALILVTGDPQEGAEAVGQFHHHLGLQPVRPEVHTTLKSALSWPDERLLAMVSSLPRLAQEAIAAL